MHGFIFINTLTDDQRTHLRKSKACIRWSLILEFVNKKLGGVRRKVEIEGNRNAELANL